MHIYTYTHIYYVYKYIINSERGQWENESRGGGGREGYKEDPGQAQWHTYLTMT